jgi:predicted nucleic acid-binding protein
VTERRGAHQREGWHQWERAGLLRAGALKQRRKARIGDALIAQSCIDQSVPLVTRDKDVRHFAGKAGLALL